MGNEELVTEAYQIDLVLRTLWRDEYFWRETDFRNAFHDSYPLLEDGPVTLADAEDKVKEQLSVMI